MNCRDIISPLELDIVDREKKIAIEFNGSYWHSEAILNRRDARNKHKGKTNLCEEKGYRLIHIFEHTYLEREKQVKNLLKSAFGLNRTKIAARKCKISNKNGSDFLEECHIQGTPNHILKYFTLEFDGRIVGCMTASNHHERGGNPNFCVLSRLAFKEDVTVQGGSSRLFKQMRLWAISQGYRGIISWSDNCISQGDIYRILGFKLDKEYHPSYFYFDVSSGTYKSKQSQRRFDKMRPKGMSILDYQLERGMLPIWDCGKKKWIYKF